MMYFYFVLPHILYNFVVELSRNTNQNTNMTNILKTNEKDRIVVVGSANMDMVISAAHFPQPGETLTGYGFMTNHGGKGANQAVAAARLGADVSFIGKVGNDDFGRATIEMMRKEGIDVSALTVTEEAPTGVALITTIPSGENTIIIEPGANAKLTPEDIDNAGGLFSRAAIVLMQLETPVNTLARTAAMAKQQGAIVVLNPAPAPTEPLPAELLQNVDLLIPNETEAATISGMAVETETDIPGAMEKLQALGIQRVIVTLGSKGACTSIGGKLTAVPSEKVEAVDTTAAGDTFCGALCTALLQGKELTEAMQYGCKAAAVSVTRRGAQMSMPYKNEIED